MHPKDAEGIADSVDPDQSSLIWVCTVCQNLSAQKFRIITVLSYPSGIIGRLYSEIMARPGHLDFLFFCL